jgi:DeoR/GlpR family transcriptional regulator of sugar metabolism
MGLARKAFSIATGGVVHYRSANQQTAHYAKKSYELQKQQARHASAKRRVAEKAAAVASIARNFFKLFGDKQ